MLSEGQKRKGHLSILEKLRSQGMPERAEDENMNSMFAQVDEEGNVITGEEPEGESPEKKKKKKRAYERGGGETRLPAADQEGAKKISNFFRG